MVFCDLRKKDKILTIIDHLIRKLFWKWSLILFWIVLPTWISHYRIAKMNYKKIHHQDFYEPQCWSTIPLLSSSLGSFTYNVYFVLKLSHPASKSELFSKTFALVSRLSFFLFFRYVCWIINYNEVAHINE